MVFKRLLKGLIMLASTLASQGKSPGHSAAPMAVFGIGAALPLPKRSAPGRYQR